MQNKMKDIQRKKILNKTQVEYGDYVINHVFGCSHGCRFPCYAFNIARRFGKVESYKEWCEPRLVSNTMDLLNKELPKIKDRIHSVQLCFTTDPFMDDYPEVGKLSLEIINRINQEKIKCIILTKGTLPSYLLKTSKINEYGITLVSLHNKFKDEYEPNSTCYQKRIDALKNMHNNGFKTWVSIEPFPTPNIDDTGIVKLLNRISFVDRIVFGRLHYNKLVKKYPHYQDFYNSTARTVIDFCKVNGIKCHIKIGTFINNKEDFGGDF